MRGCFIDFELPFKANAGIIPARDQVRRILAKAKETLELGYVGVAITYSANFQQRNKIRETYASGDWQTFTQGANQAAVMRELEGFLDTMEFEPIRNKVRIAPITTLTYSDFGGKTQEEIVKEDLGYIANLLHNGWAVLGWINEPSSGRYAVGGGIVKLPDQLEKTIQEGLAEFARRFKES
ncbi:MAG: hypothetical protein JJU34_16485 [Lunatimonas sp.]|uniref:hypothetical protein n=1 Tax=Lunatimonas sp. TaxID=2060141 RepID=UPI00263BBC1E|nr:hypothetical protein [Lunatimonas sp.]MCC5938878.1 hypothetical protein [Lunatimonas sp.]